MCAKVFFFFNDTATTEIYTLSLHDALPISTALDLLGVKRIAHGVRAIESEALLARLAAEGITLDVCPWSNVKLRITPDIAAHPIRRLHERGLKVTVSTDDPAVFGRSLTQEI